MRVSKMIPMLLISVFITGAMAMADVKIGTRQIHLDFHTSEYIEDIGADFSKEQFQSALKAANVNAINIFGKGHHSWSYYPTKVGKMHPNLKFDLLGAQIEACHEIGVLCPVYFTVGWSSNDAKNHPEWCVRNRNGSYKVSYSEWNFNAKGDEPKPNFHWQYMCVNTSYHQHILEQVEELCQNYDLDGVWFDIYQVDRRCYCKTCMAGMKAQGIDPDDGAAVDAYTAQVMLKHQKECSDLVHKYHPDAIVFFNGTTAIQSYNNFFHKMYQNNTMQDLEDLPTTWGGYDKLPLQSKYFIKAGYPITAMSGKFHTAWGEFGGFKHPNAIKYEAASMIAWGANCNFGDQLHPCGKMDMATYENIGHAYRYVETIEEYGVGGIPEAKAAIWRSFDQVHDEGLAKMLLERHVNFDVANDVKDLSQFDVILIPGIACLYDEDAKRINAFAKKGGGVIVMGEGVLDRNRKDIILDIDAEYLGEGRYDIDYLVVGDKIGQGLVESPFLCYEPAIRLKPGEKTEVLAEIHEPYFSRTYEKFSSHQNTPYQVDPADHPGVLKNGNIIFIAHELDKQYYDHGARLHRDLFVNALQLFDYEPMVTTELPSAGRISLLHQPDEKRYVAHLLYGPPIQRGRCEVIEDLPMLYNVPVEVTLKKTVKRAVLVPAMTELEMTEENGIVKVMVPEFQCHAAVVFEY